MYKIGRKVLASIAELIAHLETLTPTQLATTLKGESLALYNQQVKEIADEVAAEMSANGVDLATAQATVGTAIDFTQVITSVTADAFLANPAAPLTPVASNDAPAIKYANTAEQAAAMLTEKPEDMDCRLIGARKTNQKSADGKATQIILTFRAADSSEFTGLSYTSFFQTLAKEGSFQQFGITTEGMPILTKVVKDADGKDTTIALEPVVGIRVLKQVAGTTGYEATGVEVIKAAKEAKAYVVVAQRGRNRGKEVCYIAHTTNNDNVFRTFRDGRPDAVKFAAKEKAHAAKQTAIAEAETGSTVARMVSDDKAYEVNVVDKAKVGAEVYRMQLVLQLRMDNKEEIAAFATKHGYSLKDAADFMFPLQS